MPTTPVVRRAVALAAAILWPWIESSLAQQDIVYFATPGSDRGRAQVSGEVLDYTGREIVIRIPDGREARYPSERVERVETRLVPQQIEAEKALAAGDDSQALEHFKLAVAEEPRQWMRRKLLAEVVWCYRSLGQLAPAGKTFLILLQSDPTTPDFDAIPLAWEASEPDLQLAAVAKTWLENKEFPASILLGASYLLNTNDRATAVDRLQALARGPDPLVAGLAEAQLWRTRIATAEPAEVDGWPEKIERLPAKLRAGPYYVLGQTLARRDGQSTAAALAFLRVPILYDRDHQLSAAALLGAAAALEQGGDAVAAERLYGELIMRHAESLSAREAKNRLDGLRRNRSS